MGAFVVFAVALRILVHHVGISLGHLLIKEWLV